MSVHKLLSSYAQSLLCVDELCSRLVKSICDDLFTALSRELGIPYALLKDKFSARLVEKHSLLLSSEGVECSVVGCGRLAHINGTCSRHVRQSELHSRQQRILEYASIVETAQKQQKMRQFEDLRGDLMVCVHKEPCGTEELLRGMLTMDIDVPL
jgi:hypothetical protein